MLIDVEEEELDGFDISKYLLMFRDYLVDVWDPLYLFLEDHDWEKDENFITHWVQVNWQGLLEQKLMPWPKHIKPLSIPLILPNQDPAIDPTDPSILKTERMSVTYDDDEGNLDTHFEIVAKLTKDSQDLHSKKAFPKETVFRFLGFLSSIEEGRFAWLPPFDVAHLVVDSSGDLVCLPMKNLSFHLRKTHIKQEQKKWDGNKNTKDEGKYEKVDVTKQMLRFKDFLRKGRPYAYLLMGDEMAEDDYNDVLGGFWWGNHVMFMREFSQEECFINKFSEISYKEAYLSFYLEVFVKTPLGVRDDNLKELIPQDVELVYRGFYRDDSDDKYDRSIICLGFGDEKRGSSNPGRHCKYFYTPSKECSFYIKKCLTK